MILNLKFKAFYFVVERLRPNSTFEFRVIARMRDGSVSKPSIVSDVIQLRPSMRLGLLHSAPSKPQPPEYVDFEGNDRVTLCWYPAVSSLPILVCFGILLYDFK